MIKQLLFATTNKGKISEIKEVATRYPGLQILSLDDLSPKIGTPPEVSEDGDSYEINSSLKARAYYGWSGMATLADDAGLEVDALNGAPGVISARYAGLPADSKKNVEKLLRNLGNAETRTARFVSFLHLTMSPVDEFTAKGIVEGKIDLKETGKGGFGYDPIFIPSGYDLSLAALKERGIEVPTHRIIAATKLFEHLRQNRIL